MRVFRFIFCWLLFSCVSFDVSAHALRVAKLTIEETTPAYYQLRYDVPSGEEASYPTPRLPTHCDWQTESGPMVSSGLMKLVFHCSGGVLTANDQLVLDWQRSGVMVSMAWHSGVNARQFFAVEPDGIVVRFGDLHAGSGDLYQTAVRYTQLGIEHILMGIDHLFFVVALLLLVSSRIKLIAAITAFTIGHSVTLALSVVDLLRLNMAVVETLIALSIVLMAKEILLSQRGIYGLAWRYPAVIALAFGLVHGLGFADVLMSLGIENEALLPTLLFFNLGIELGQLMFIAVIAVLLWLLKVAGVCLTTSHSALLTYGLGVTAMVWFLTRLCAVF